MSAPARLALVALALCFALPASAQFKAVKHGNDDIDMGPADKPAPAPVDEAPEEKVVEDGRFDTYIPGVTNRVLRGGRDAGVDGPRAAQRASGRDAGTGDAGVADGGDGGEPEKVVKPIVLPPPDGEDRLRQAWSERAQAVERKAVKDVLDREKAVAQLRAELGIDNLFFVGASLAREAEALAATDAAEAVRRAVLAADLAPDLPAAHWAVARTAFREDLTNVGRYGGSAVEALAATWREPRWRSALLLELAAALLGALLVAGAALVVLVFLRYARYFLHDFHHLFPAGAWTLQTAIAGVLFVSLPVLFGLGPFAFLLGLALATWLHMGRGERIVVAAAFAVAGFVPLAATYVEREATFVGTRAEVVYLGQHGGPDGPSLPALKALVDRADAPYEAVFALGRRARLRGEVEAAVALLRQAASLRSGAVEALLELGNAQFLAGDLDGARESYQRVALAHDDSAEAHFNLARYYDRRAKIVSREEAAAQITEAQAHERRVIELSPKLGAALGSDSDLRAHRFLAAAPLDVSALRDLARNEAHPAWVGDALAARMFWFFPRGLSWLAGLAAAALLGLFTFLDRPITPSNACGKCGRPVCRRCDAEVVGPALCGQCLTIFSQRVAVDPPARAAKEVKIKKYQRQRVWVTRLAGVLVPGGGQVVGGHAPAGALVLYLAALGGWFVAFHDGLVPTPWGASPALLRLVPAGLLLALAWLVGARMAIRETAGLALLKVVPPPDVTPKTDPGLAKLPKVDDLGQLKL